MRALVNDLAMGVRLAVGGGRTSVVRFVLSALGIGTAVAVLLIAASIDTMRDNRMARAEARTPIAERVAGVEPTYHRSIYHEFRDEQFLTHYVAASGPGSPAPAGLPRLPSPGEMYPSAALAELLGSEEGELLRPRFPEVIVGILDERLVPEPGALTAWVGAEERALAGGPSTSEAYGFGTSNPAPGLGTRLLLVLLVGTVALLLPVFVFVSSASRIAGAERDRRLSAVRLVGADGQQVRRIAAAEALVSAVAGLFVGIAVFLVGRGFADHVDLWGERVYGTDVTPNPLLAMAVVVGIPALAVLTALFALRRTIIEPLGVVRHSRPVRRRVWWRLALVVLGIVLLWTRLGYSEEDTEWQAAVVAGAALMLVGVPVLLPWLLERAVGRLTGGPPSWQIAIRRMQLDSGTAARVVGGVAVILAAAIALQTVLLSVEGNLGVPRGVVDKDAGAVEVEVGHALAPEVRRDLAAADGVTAAHVIQSQVGYVPDKDDTALDFTVLGCAELRALGGPTDCADGDILDIAGDSGAAFARQGDILEWRAFPPDGDAAGYEVTGRWTVPSNPRTVRPRGDAALTFLATNLLYTDIVVTPGALGSTPLPDTTTSRVVAVVAPDLTSDQLEGIRNAVADVRMQSTVFTHNMWLPDMNPEQSAFVDLRTTLYAGSVITLLLSGISLLVLALEHIRERRRQLAVLVATGVPRAVLARALLWQVVLPITLGVVAATACGIGLAALALRLLGEPLRVDWTSTTVLGGAAIALSLLVSAGTLPFLRGATKLTALRTE